MRGRLVASIILVTIVFLPSAFTELRTASAQTDPQPLSEAFIQGLRDSGLSEEQVQRLTAKPAAPAPSQQAQPLADNQDEQTKTIDFILKKAIFAGFLGIIAAAYADRRRIVAALSFVASASSSLARNAITYIGSDGHRLIAAAIVIAALLFAWMFRNEHMQGHLFRNRFTGEVFDGRE